MISGKKFKTLREAKIHLKLINTKGYGGANIYKMGKIFPRSKYKYFVGTRVEWLNL